MKGRSKSESTEEEVKRISADHQEEIKWRRIES